LASISRIAVQVSQSIKVRLYWKNKESKKDWGFMAQVVDHLPSKCEALSSNSSTAKIKNKEALRNSFRVGNSEG
jgi:hypothetical protein